MRDIMEALSEYSEEWRILVNEYFKPKCELYGYCTEHDTCNRKPRQKEESKLKITFEDDKIFFDKWNTFKAKLEEEQS